MKDAIENGNNIIVSNEYNGSEELDDRIYDLLISYPSIKFVTCPSYLDENNFNRTKIYYNDENTIDYTIYKKHNPYTERGKIVENINYDDDVKFILFHIENIGIFTIVICKDVFSDYVEAFINDAQVDVIIIMAKTLNYSKFISKLKMFSSNKRIGLLCNSCAESKKLNSSGIIVYYDKDKAINKENENFKLMKNKCDFRCDKFCCCYFQFDIEYNSRNLIISKDYIHVLR